MSFKLLKLHDYLFNIVSSACLESINGIEGIFLESIIGIVVIIFELSGLNQHVFALIYCYNTSLLSFRLLMLSRYWFSSELDSQCKFVQSADRSSRMVLFYVTSLTSLNFEEKPCAYEISAPH